MFNLNTPVAFIVYNRSEKTRKVFESIRNAKPSKLFLIADGPNKNKVGDLEKCENVKKIIENIDWDCQIYRNYSEENLGCKIRVSTGINWVFEHVEDAIILEDDCLPNLSFYRYCQELLEHYRENPTVMMISGDNFQNGKKRGNSSYYFSRYAHIWGWATWKRAWQFNDVELESLTKFISEKKINLIFKKTIMKKYWTKYFERFSINAIDTWDFQWAYSIWAKNGLIVLPQANLISNIGFDSDALHTKDVNSKFSRIISTEIQFPLIHPNILSADEKADIYTFNNVYYSGFAKRALRKIYNLLLKK